MASLFITLDSRSDAALPTTARQSEDGARSALSVDDLDALKKQLHASGRSLRDFLRARNPALRVAASATPTPEELFEPLDKPAVEPPAELQARRAFLAARQEERDYGNLVSSVQQHVLAEKERESFATYHQQAGLGANFFTSILTATLLGYFVGRATGDGNRVRSRLLLSASIGPLLHYNVVSSNRVVVPA